MYLIDMAIDMQKQKRINKYFKNMGKVMLKYLFYHILFPTAISNNSPLLVTEVVGGGGGGPAAPQVSAGSIDIWLHTTSGVRSRQLPVQCSMPP